jgi:hypothetical protein
MQPGELHRAMEYYLACRCITLGPTQPPIQWVLGTLSHGAGGRSVNRTIQLRQVPKSRKVEWYVCSLGHRCVTVAVIASEWHPSWREDGPVACQCPGPSFQVLKRTIYSYSISGVLVSSSLCIYSTCRDRCLCTGTCCIYIYATFKRSVCTWSVSIANDNRINLHRENPPLCKSKEKK